MVRDSFTKKEIPRGTGLMYVKKDGTIYYFADKKSEKNLFKLNRNPKETKWTTVFEKGTKYKEKEEGKSVSGEHKERAEQEKKVSGEQKERLERKHKEEKSKK